MELLNNMRVLLGTLALVASPLTLAIVVLPSTDKQEMYAIGNTLQAKAPVAQIDTTTLPLLTISDFEYQGGFRVSSDKYGDTAGSTADYSRGVIALNPKNASMFISGHTSEQGVGEFKVPAITNSRDISTFAVGNEVLQNFYAFHETSRVDTGIESFFRLTGMQLIGSKLVVNYISWYNADGLEADTTVVFQDASKLGSTDIVGSFQMEGSAHSSGWMTPIPDYLQETLGGTHISGYSGGSIASRLSIGPSGWVVTPEKGLLDKYTGGSFAAIPLLDFPITNMLYDKAVYGDSYDSSDDISYNVDLRNKLWTAVSEAAYGFIVEGTDTYVTIGSSGGHEFGMGYKITQDDGTLCGGPCTKVASDVYNYMWLWRVSDLVKVKNGLLEPYDVRPYAHGEFDTIITSPITGAAFDFTTNSLYVALNNGDTIEQYTRPPLFLKYNVKVGD